MAHPTQAVLRVTFEELHQRLGLQNHLTITQAMPSEGICSTWLDLRLVGDGLPQVYEGEPLVRLRLADLLPECKEEQAAHGGASGISGHGRIVCSCGALIAQCRCPENYHPLMVRPYACAACQKRDPMPAKSQAETRPGA